MIQKSADLANRFCVRLAQAFASFLIVIICAVVSSAIPATAATYVLATTNLLEGPDAGTDSVILSVSPPTGSWTVTNNTSWIHLATSGGAGSATVVFSCDANQGLTRSGSFTVGGQVVTVTQVGVSYIPAPEPATALVSTGLNRPRGVAVDGAGNVFIADRDNSAIKKWSVTNNSVTTLVSTGLSGPYGLAVDNGGNVYIADSGNNVIKKWSALGNTVTTLVSSGLLWPVGVAVDGAGNVYIADAGNNAIKKWIVASNSVVTLISSGLNIPSGVAVDGAGNVFIADAGNDIVKKWSATNGAVNTVMSGLSYPCGVAVDGSGNLYVANYFGHSVWKWSVSKGASVGGASVGLSTPSGVAVDGAGNLYIADFSNDAIKELPFAFLNATVKSEAAAASGDVLPPVVPATANLKPPFAPSVDQPWLTLGAPTNGVVSFAFSANINVDRIAHITLFGVPVSIVQHGPSYTPSFSLGTNSLLVGPNAGTAVVPLNVLPDTGTWTAAANTNWLHLSAANQSGIGTTNVVFTYDTNSSPTRTGILVIAGQSLPVTQAGASYVAISSPPAFVDPTPRSESPAAGQDVLPVVLATPDVLAQLAPTSDQPWLNITGVTNGVINFAFSANASGPRTAHITVFGKSIPIWQQAFALHLGTATLLEGPNAGYDSIVLAVTPNTNTWIATANNSWLHLDPANQSGSGSTNLVFAFDVYTGGTRSGTLTIGGQTLTVIQAGASYTNIPAQLLTPTSALSSASPFGVAVDGSGNLYVAETGYTVQKWSPINNSMTTLIPFGGVSSPTGVAVDSLGYLYIADRKHYVVKKWSPIDGSLTTLISSGLAYPYGVAVDESGNVYVADYTNNAVMKWSITNNTLSTLVSGLKKPNGVAVDAAGNVYIADTSNHAIKKWSPVNGSVTSLVASGLNFPSGVAVDGAGNVYIADSQNNAVKKWSAVTKTVTTLVAAGLNYPTGVAVDNTGNLFIANYALASGGNLKELPFALVDPTPISEGPASGTDTLPAVLPVTVNLSPPFAPTNNQPWLTIVSNNSGVVSFSFTATSSNRTANVTLLGQSIPISQAAPPYLLAPLALANGNFQLNFSNSPRGSFTIISTTNLSLPASNWSVLGTPASVAPGWFQFTAPAATNGQPQFFKVRSP